MNSKIGVVLCKGSRVRLFSVINFFTIIVLLFIFWAFSRRGSSEDEVTSVTDKHTVFILALCVIISSRIAKVIQRICVAYEQYDRLSVILQGSTNTFIKYILYDFFAVENLVVLVLFVYFYTFVFRNIGFVLFNCPLFLLFYHFKRLSNVELNGISEENHLCVGYGLAFFYYHNYLCHVLENFRQRVDEFSLDHRVYVQKKLFILLPKSCIVEKYIDENYDRIQWTRELPQLSIDVGGIRDRIFNITVYEVCTRNGERSTRCAVEYAQPLRHLKELEMTKSQVQIERLKFIENLKRFLNDNQKSHKSVCLVEYDDESEFCNIADLILDLCDF